MYFINSQGLTKVLASSNRIQINSAHTKEEVETFLVLSGEQFYWQTRPSAAGRVPNSINCGNTPINLQVRVDTGPLSVCACCWPLRTENGEKQSCTFSTQAEPPTPQRLRYSCLVTFRRRVRMEQRERERELLAQ